LIYHIGKRNNIEIGSNMIDIHCHLLPGVDDGPKSMEEALEMARLAVKNGITHAVITPHITPGRYDNTLDSLFMVYDEFSRALRENHIPLQTALASEVRLDPVIINMVESGTLPFLGDYDGHQLLLLEFPYTSIPPGALELAQWLVKRRIKPVIAHPERHRTIINNVKTLEPYLKAGCLVQITAGSLSGIFGDIPKKTAIKLLELGWVTVMASDAHNNKLRPPELEPGRVVAEKIVGEQESWALVRERPGQMTARHFHDLK
jgi:protein-tyrosine phosphatase